MAIDLARDFEAVAPHRLGAITRRWPRPRPPAGGPVVGVTEAAEPERAMARAAPAMPPSAHVPNRRMSPPGDRAIRAVVGRRRGFTRGTAERDAIDVNDRFDNDEIEQPARPDLCDPDQADRAAQAGQLADPKRRP